ncbi:10541_t:CDS:2 [Ambispora leptoticha]|uniref:Glycerol-3-phosphate dehydrogenase [NAD(+)] n=1 Tax=Ambispora leptoticha TaxID=144679 RepID=A0A9N9BBI6_9GLOM|nr:10541_t:CDS:2 [Ambispora leptoticha]
MKLEKVALVGSGNWGSAIAKIIGNNVQLYPEFDNEVKMWVYEEFINGQKLTDIINEKNENVKYLPGIKLSSNIKAVPDLLETVRDATILVFVIPHQFVKGVCNQLKGQILPHAKAISLIKGFDVNETGICPMTEVIAKTLNINVSSLSGANIANEIAEENFSETTIGYRVREEGELYKRLFETPYFRVGIIDDVIGVELCGALKNVVAIAAGIIDGLRLGDNAKAAIIRIGLLEMKKFVQTFYRGIKEETFFESCGIADVITTSYGGRNRRVAEAFVITRKPFEHLEKELLAGQKLQGTLTAQEINHVLRRKGLENEYKLFTTVYRIAYQGLPPERLVKEII